MQAHPLVSPAGSGAGRRWRPFSADRSGNVDRFAAERHRRSLTPSRAQGMVESVPSLAREGDFIFNILIGFPRGLRPLVPLC